MKKTRSKIGIFHHFDQIKKIHHILKNKAKNSAGFTLLEMIFVIAVLFVLLGLFVTSNDRTVDDAKIAEMKAEVGRLKVAIDSFTAYDTVYIKETWYNKDSVPPCKGAYDTYKVYNTTNEACTPNIKPEHLSQDFLIKRGYLESPLKYFTKVKTTTLNSTLNGEENCKLTYKKPSTASSNTVAPYGIEVSGCNFFPSGFVISTMQ